MTNWLRRLLLKIRHPVVICWHHGPKRFVDERGNQHWTCPVCNRIAERRAHELREELAEKARGLWN